MNVCIVVGFLVRLLLLGLGVCCFDCVGGLGLFWLVFADLVFWVFGLCLLVVFAVGFVGL